MPGLEPGVYDVKTELTGFAPATRERVTLGVNATITLDFRLRLAGVEETLTVTGEAPLIEVTQSKVASSIETTELQNLPMITRTRQRHAGAAARRDADRAAPSHQGERRERVVRRRLGHERDPDRRRRRQPRQPVTAGR